MLTLHKVPELLKRLVFLHQRVANIGAVKAADLDQRSAQIQQTQDILPRSLVRGGGQRQKRQRRKMAFDLPARAVFRAEIVSPLRNAVRLVHRYHRQPPLLQLLEHVVHHQTLGRDIQHLNAPAAARGHHLVLLLAALGGIQTGRRHAIGQQLIDLILHQQNQR